MINKNNDSKFIIYQVLYIFVITVLALKGAELDLNRVVNKENVVDVSVRDSLKILIDSLYAQGLKFDIKLDEKVENDALKEKLTKMNKQLAALTTKLNEIPPEERIEKEPAIIENAKLQSPISVSQTFIQNTWNEVKNSGDVTTFIFDSRNPNSPIVSIQPGEKRRFDLTDQTELLIKFGSQVENVKVSPNRIPEIKIERVTTKMNAGEIYVNELQRITAFKVTILDERPEQLKVTYSGPISVAGPFKDVKGSLIYNVSLNIAPNEARFEEWIDRNSSLKEADGRYKTNFFFTVVDEKSKDRVQVGDSFFFTDFAK
ncbi:MAG: hypothetical protein HXY50_14330 [Ignavibacteriaceae bacterium]|nr:hypothetical protein [Ignavibacteriaceae bacterium]